MGKESCAFMQRGNGAAWGPVPSAAHVKLLGCPTRCSLTPQEVMGSAKEGPTPPASPCPALCLSPALHLPFLASALFPASAFPVQFPEP